MIEPITPAQFANNLALIALKAVKHLAITLNDCYAKFWQRDPADIIAALNANVPLALARFQANTELGAAVNAKLEATGDDLRVIVTMPEGYGFDGQQFNYTSPE